MSTASDMSRARERLAERTRIKAILTSPEAQSRPALAAKLALEGETPADVAMQALRAAPAANANERTTQYDRLIAAAVGASQGTSDTKSSYDRGREIGLGLKSGGNDKRQSAEYQRGREIVLRAKGKQ